MITFNPESRESRPASGKAPPSNSGSGFSAWYIESPRRRPEINQRLGAQIVDRPGDSTSQNLDLLVSDIAKLARSYLSPADCDGPFPTQAFEASHSGNAEASDADEADLLDAVRSLLDTALQRMRGSSACAPEREAPAVPARPRGGIAPSALRRVREHIDQNLGEHIEIADLATLTGLSPCHFSRAFKQSMGVPPHRYLITRRIQEATRLIESTDRPMFEIALDVGFSDQSHFTRVFSSQVGESPSQFRHQRR